MVVTGVHSHITGRDKIGQNPTSRTRVCISEEILPISPAPPKEESDAINLLPRY